MEPNKQLSRDMCPKNNEECTYMKKIPYLKAVGSIMYLATTTHLDIAYAAGTLARFSPGGLSHAYCHLKPTNFVFLSSGRI